MYPYDLKTHFEALILRIQSYKCIRIKNQMRNRSGFGPIVCRREARRVRRAGQGVAWPFAGHSYETVMYIKVCEKKMAKKVIFYS